jgi:sulfite reductase alpha subunit-like flavoprotein
VRKKAAKRVYHLSLLRRATKSLDVAVLMKLLRMKCQKQNVKPPRTLKSLLDKNSRKRSLAENLKHCLKSPRHVTKLANFPMSKLPQRLKTSKNENVAAFLEFTEKDKDMIPQVLQANEQRAARYYRISKEGLLTSRGPLVVSLYLMATKRLL